MFLKHLTRVQYKLFDANIIYRRHYETSSWKDKLLFKFDIGFPKLKQFLGPTGDEVAEKVDLTGKRCLITGGTNGIGMEIVRILVKKNCDVVLACRNPYAANMAAKNIWSNPDKITAYKTNLTSLASVKETCKKLLDKDENLKWSIRNTICPSMDQLSLPESDYTSIKAYNVSKICGIFAMRYMSHLWSNTKKAIFCAHPGSFVKTGLCTNWWPYEVLYTSMIPFSKNISQASATPLFCAISPNLEGCTNMYVKDCKECDPSVLARDYYLSFRVAELCRNNLEEKIGFIEQVDVAKNVAEKVVSYESKLGIEPATEKIEAPPPAPEYARHEESNRREREKEPSATIAATAVC